MKKVLLTLVLFMIFICFSGFKYDESETNSENEYVFDIDDLYEYQKTYDSEEIGLCSISGATKSYMDYRATNNVNSRQYKFIREELTVDSKTGLLYDSEGFIAAALGSYFGEIGDRFYFTLDSGIVLPIVKCEGKADTHTDYTNCYHSIDGSIIEFVIDSSVAKEYFGTLSNSYILNGNFNNYSLFNGEIVKMEKVTGERSSHYVTYSKSVNDVSNIKDTYNYASGY